MASSKTNHHTYTFDEFTLDLDRGALIDSGADVKLRPKSFEMLSYLVQRQGLLVPKDELLDVIWGQTVVTEGSITQCIKDIRSALHDTSRQKILTIPRRGFIFDLPLTSNGGGTVPDATFRSRFIFIQLIWLTLSAFILILTAIVIHWAFIDRVAKVPLTAEAPSIAVLPFQDMSPEQDQAYFADGISEEILSLLAHVPGLRVIARTSSFSFRGQNLDIATISERLNVTHVLEGSVRKFSNRMRITAQLVDARNSEHLWSETFDRDLENTFVLQDEISVAIVRTLIQHLDPQAEIIPRLVTGASAEAHGANLRGPVP
jgi:TolB-like protein/DNA-binding winged helix-turn-helix (wHTH) protein